MPVTVWSSDTSYSPPAAAGVDQSTKIAPSAGEAAQGFVPDQHMPIQWLNWLLNAICTLSNTNESGLAVLQALSRTLQAAYDESVVQAETNPHVDVDTSELLIGNTSFPDLLKVDGANDRVLARALQIVSGGLSVVGGVTFTDAFDAYGDLIAHDDVSLGALTQFVIDHATGNMTMKLANLRINGGGSGQRALIHDGAGVAGDLRLESGTWTPTCVAVSGSGIVVGDWTGQKGRWTRVGDIVTFSFVGNVDPSGWSAGNTMSISLPVSTAHATAYDVPATVDTSNKSVLDLYVDAVVSASAARLVVIPGGGFGSSVQVSCTGSYVVQ